MVRQRQTYSTGRTSARQPLKGKFYTFLFPPAVSSRSIFHCSKLLEGKKSIRILDPYIEFNNPDYFIKYVSFFKHINVDNVKIEILTCAKYSNFNKDELDNYAEAIGQKISENGIVSYEISLIVFKEGELLNKNSLWHDRFLFLDDKVYSVGTSISGQMACSRIFGVYEIIENQDKVIIYQVYNELKNLSKDNSLAITAINKEN